MDMGSEKAFEHGDDFTALALSCQAARPLLSQFRNGLLEERQARTVEIHLNTCASCAHELKLLKAEDALLAEALSDLKPSISFRTSVAKMCSEVIKHAEHVANSVPEPKWAQIRWALALIAVLHFAFLSILLDSPAHLEGLEEMNIASMDAANAEGSSRLEWFSSSFWEVTETRSTTYWINLFFFLLSLFLLIGGRLLADFESRLSAKLAKSERDGPSRLEVLALEILGVLGLLATSAIHHFLMMIQ